MKTELNRLMTCLCAGLMMLVAVSSAFGQSTKPTTSPAPATSPAATQAVDDGSLGPFAEMPKVCGLDAAQVAKVKAAVDAMHEAMKTYWNDKQNKLGLLQMALSKAIQAGNVAEQKTLQAQVDAITMTNVAKIRTEHLAKAYAVLTPVQRLAWETYTLKDILRENYWKVKFTPEQIKKADALYEQAARKVIDLKDPGDEKARDDIVLDLAKKIDETVLSEEQRKKQ